MSRTESKTELRLQNALKDFEDARLQMEEAREDFQNLIEDAQKMLNEASVEFGDAVLEVKAAIKSHNRRVNKRDDLQKAIELIDRAQNLLEDI